MRKAYKRLERNGRIYILHLETEGVLFGPTWSSVASCESNKSNLERYKAIVRLLNECETHTNHHSND